MHQFSRCYTRLTRKTKRCAQRGGSKKTKRKKKTISAMRIKSLEGWLRKHPLISATMIGAGFGALSGAGIALLKRNEQNAETNKQLNQFSKIFFEKSKMNYSINEK